jgi:hypothetical protein
MNLTNNIKTLNKYFFSLIRKKFYGSVKISFQNGLPVAIKEEKSIDTTLFRQEIRESLEKNQLLGLLQK